MTTTIVSNSTIKKTSQVTQTRGQGNWTRPADWPALPSITNTDEKMVALYGVWPTATRNYVSLQCAGDYTVDWGDGTVENFASGVQAYHQYAYANGSLSAVTSEGYKTATVVITPQAGQHLTSINLHKAHNAATVEVGYAISWLDIAISSPQLTSINVGAAPADFAVMPWLLQRFQLLSMSNSLTNFKGLLSSACACADITLPDTTYITNMSYMFMGLCRIKSFAGMNTSAVTNMSYMFYGCTSITVSPSIDSSLVTDFIYMFYGCYSLREVSSLNTALGTAFTGTFSQCLSLQKVPALNCVSATDISGLFNSCTLLLSVTLTNTGSVTNMSNLFNGCNSLKKVSLGSTAACTNMSGMFSGCYVLTDFPTLDTHLVTNMNSMFANCRSMVSSPITDTHLVTNGFSLFLNCFSLVEAPALDTSQMTALGSMFNNCSSLVRVPPINTSAAVGTSTDAAVSSLLKVAVGGNTTPLNTLSGLGSVPQIDVASVADVSAAAIGSFSGIAASFIPTPLNTATFTWNTLSTFFSSSFLAVVPAVDLRLSTSVGQQLGTCPVATRVLAKNIKVAFSPSIMYPLLGKTALEELFSNCGNVASGAITITGCAGADTPVVLTGTLTSGSTTVTMASTAGLTTGMLVRGTGVSTAVAVTFTDAGDTVNRTAHGLSNDQPVSFATVVTTTGVVTNTIYYVVNKTADNFQVAATVGGAALPLTTNGSGTLNYGTFIQSIVPNTSVTLTVPASASGAQSLTFRTLNTSVALMKGFTITG